MSEKEMSKRQARREQMRRKEVRGRWIGFGLITFGAILLAFLFIYPNLKPVGEVVTPAALARPNAKFNAAGDPNAPIKIDEYSDFQCPYCRNFYEQTEVQLMDTYVKDGVVYFAYHSFGEFIGSESAASAEAAYCAGDQDKFWEMHDIIFANQNGENIGAFADRRLLAFAKQLGLDMNKFTSCFDGKNYSALIKKDGEDGISAGIKATPSFVLSYTVNGTLKTKIIEGAQSYETFSQEIEAALAEMGK
ncbi:MAG: thioredoxin domain-containing protein [Anaerolineales bacterium]|nr:thioredoxin domain-containing protein [Anaerolineales bacterium]